MKMTQKALATTLALAALVNNSGCMSETSSSEANHSEGSAFRVVYEDVHCPFTEKRLQVLHSANEVNSLFAAEPALKTRIGASPAALPEKLGDALASADFTRDTWILVAWGSQPNPGYRAVATGTQAHFADGTLQLPLSMQPPAAGTMHAQVIVTPCQLISVEIREPIERIELQ